MGRWAREPLTWSAVGSAAAYAVIAALTAEFLFGPNGWFGTYTGTLIEFLNEIFGMGRHVGATALIGLGLFFLAPFGVGLVLQTWHWVWLSPLALVLAELLTWIPHLLAGERPVPFGAIPWILVLFGLPAAVGAAFGTGLGRYFRYLRRGDVAAARGSEEMRVSDV
jgi:hypothetical protein